MKINLKTLQVKRSLLELSGKHLEAAAVDFTIKTMIGCADNASAMSLHAAAKAKYTVKA